MADIKNVTRKPHSLLEVERQLAERKAARRALNAEQTKAADAVRRANSTSEDKRTVERLQAESEALDKAERKLRERLVAERKAFGAAFPHIARPLVKQTMTALKAALADAESQLKVLAELSRFATDNDLPKPTRVVDLSPSLLARFRELNGFIGDEK